jgi:hypothetical protein
MSKASEAHLPTFLARYGRVRGRLSWKNAGRETFAPRRAEIHAPLHGRLGDGPHAALVHGAVLPGSEGDLRIKFRIGANCPPGIYESHLEVGGKTVPILVAVPESRSFKIKPNHVTLDGDESSGEERILFVKNDGNVRVTIDHPRAVRMEPTNRSCVVIRSTLDKARSPGRMPVQDALVDAAAESVNADPIFGARIAGAPITLQPGGAMALTVRFRVPDLVEPEYSAQLWIAGAPLVVRVLNTVSSGAQAPNRVRRTKRGPQS